MKKQIEVEIKGNFYTLKIPNTGQYVDIELKKLALSNNSYGDAWRTMLKPTHQALDFVDVIAYLTVLIPNNELKKHLKVDTFAELSILDMKELSLIYKAKILPWITEWQDELEGFKLKNDLSETDEHSTENVEKQGVKE